MNSKYYEDVLQYSKDKNMEFIVMNSDLISKIRDNEFIKSMIGDTSVSDETLKEMRRIMPVRRTLHKNECSKTSTVYFNIDHSSDFVECLYVSSKKGCRLQLSFYTAIVDVPPGEHVVVPINLMVCSVLLSFLTIHVESGEVDSIDIGCITLSQTDLRNRLYNSAIYQHLWDSAIFYSVSGTSRDRKEKEKYPIYRFSPDGKLFDISCKDCDRNAFIERLKRYRPEILHDRLYRDYFVPEIDLVFPDSRALIEAFYEAIDEKSLLRKLPNELLDTIAYYLV